MQRLREPAPSPPAGAAAGAAALRRAGRFLLWGVLLALPCGTLYFLKPHLALPEGVFMALFVMSWLPIPVSVALAVIAVAELERSWSHLIEHLQRYRLIRWVLGPTMLAVGAALTAFVLACVLEVGVETMELWRGLPIIVGLLWGGFVLCFRRRPRADAPAAAVQESSPADGDRDAVRRSP